jgi:hypothetical protein
MNTIARIKHEIRLLKKADFRRGETRRKVEELEGEIRKIHNFQTRDALMGLLSRVCTGRV